MPPLGGCPGPITDERRDRIKKSRVSRTAALEKIEELVAKGLKHPLITLMELSTGYELVEVEIKDYAGNVINVELVPQEIKAGLDRDGEQAYGVDPQVRVKAAAELANYMYPKKKSIEHTGNDGAPIIFGVVPDLSPLPLDEVQTIEASGTSSTPITSPRIDYLGPLPEVEEDLQLEAPADIP